MAKDAAQGKAKEQKAPKADKAKAQKPAKGEKAVQAEPAPKVEKPAPHLGRRLTLD